MSAQQLCECNKVMVQSTARGEDGGSVATLVCPDGGCNLKYLVPPVEPTPAPPAKDNRHPLVIRVDALEYIVRLLVLKLITKTPVTAAELGDIQQFLETKS